MENLIRDVIELDKAARQAVEQLEQEKSKLGDFLRGERKKIEAKYKEEAINTLLLEKKKLQEEVSARKLEIQEEYKDTFKELEDSFKKQKDAWVEAIFEYCIKD